VIDEQHRFGVDQREALAQKGEDAHLLLMTATPIPRTLAMTLYGDLDVSILKGMPPGRGDLTTHWLRGPERRGLSKKLLPRLERGEQVFWVCPRITGDGGGRTASAERRYEQALASDLAQFGVELAHGRIPAEERSYRLDRFRSGEVGLLVATTVIEVGVDVPGATVMVIENAERLGLAQLHQLRGRVGRGPKDSVCYLLGDKKAEKRLRLLEKSRDGFELAEADMETRGMGDLAGVRQSGANLEGLGQEDVGLLILARELIRMEEGLGRMYVGQIGQVTP
jgi:ATP-dependent DNA helicase RecG